jgi:mono/diheme cytochrome c family protein
VNGLLRTISLALLAAAAIAAAGCGSKGVVSDSDATVEQGAQMFAQRCSGCHTLSAAGTQGSGTRELRAQGPNLDQRPENEDDVLFAIRNGGYSGSIMPQNNVVGADAEAVAKFVAKYAGTQANSTPRPTSTGSVSNPNGP